MSDYAALLTRLRAWVLDAEGRVWTDDLLTEGLRQALSDLMQASGQRYVLNGLDGETAPSDLPRDLWPLLLRGALGYALLGRAAARLEPLATCALTCPRRSKTWRWPACAPLPRPCPPWPPPIPASSSRRRRPLILPSAGRPTPPPHRRMPHDGKPFSQRRPGAVCALVAR